MTAAPPIRNYARLAWWVIIAAFLLFCLLMLGLCYGVWSIKAFALSQPAQPATLVQHVGGVEILRKGLAQYELPTPPQTVLYEGDAVRVARSAPPGVAAVVTLFDGSTIELWPGTRLTLEQVQTTRFSTRNQQVAVRIHSGQVRLRLTPRATQQYQNVRYSLLVERPGQAAEQTELEVGGAYRVRLVSADAPTTSASERATLKPDVLQTEYVADQGRMTIGFGELSQQLQPGEMAYAADGRLTAPARAEWQFLRDGHFTDFTEREYNNNTEPITETNLVRSDTWRVYGAPAAGQMPYGGIFSVVGGCARRNSVDATQCVQPLLNVAQFRRDLTAEQDYTSGFKTAITQTVGLDVTPYAQLSIKFTGRIYVQSLNRAGFIGEECALGVVVHYTNIADAAATQTYCYYANDADGPGIISTKPDITSEYIPLRQWRDLSIDLAPLLPKMQRFDYIEIYGNGHDYISEVADVRLLAQ
jgi:hypothetical protein